MLFTAIARLLVTFNSSVNPWVYATTVPDFKKTVRRLVRRKTGLNLFSTSGTPSGDLLNSRNDSKRASNVSRKTSSNVKPDKKLLKSDSIVSTAMH